MRLDDAQAFLLKIPEIEFRAMFAIRFAEKRIALSDSYSGARLLADVGELADKSDNVLAKAQVLLGVATLYEKIDHLSALTRLSDAVRAINKLKAGDALGGRVMRVIKTPEMSYYASYQVAGYELEEVFQELSKNDFGNAYSNAQILDDKYYKTIAVFTVAKNCLEKRPKINSRKTTNTSN